jgi:hypothetical protein
VTVAPDGTASTSLVTAPTVFAGLKVRADETRKTARDADLGSIHKRLLDTKAKARRARPYRGPTVYPDTIGCLPPTA